MTIEYNCTVKFSEYPELTAEDINKAIAAVEAEGYNCYLDSDELTIQGTIPTDINDSLSAEEMISTISWLLWKSAEIDADVDAKEIYDEDEHHESAFAEQMRFYYAGL